MKENKNTQLVENVPFAVYESAMTRNERHIKRLWVALVIAIIAIVITNAAWLMYESLYDTINYSQDGEGVNNICTGSQGDVYGTEATNQKTQERKE